MFKDEDLFLQLCIHGVKHNFSKFNWAVDIANFMLVKKDMDYSYISSQAKELGCANMYSYSLGLINSLFKLDIKGADDMNSSFAEDHTVANLFSKNHNDTDISLFPRLFDSNADKFRYYLNNCVYPTPIEFSLVKLNGGLFFIYYILRVFRIFYKGIIKMF